MIIQLQFAHLPSVFRRNDADAAALRLMGWPHVPIIACSIGRIAISGASLCVVYASMNIQSCTLTGERKPPVNLGGWPLGIHWLILAGFQSFGRQLEQSMHT
jgi:hypothetical protein